ncbi:ABC transporter substrate-binding protein [Geobacter sp. SVR]|uniref:ABC transporter substrate-binding protein n=1 Tax=Geobacter sp. SVR TaxID=2495594 RepID=UPI00143EFC82|nr:ABC transporter substrate-binding protein [Geobacter sp. SVR]BCS55058.1 ABC transporter substrate-binding protein [Geobacter sp. SVR]GCF85240.1 ABC transporter substrate-binding protein [Geobacter sp. SVR]
MIRIFVLLAAFLVAAVLPAHARQIIDMTGRKVTVPDRITRVYSSSPPGTWLLYAVDPSLLAGLNFAPGEREQRFLRPEFGRLPVVGGVVGHGRGLNMETLLKIKPDIVLVWDWQQQGINGRFEETFQKLGIPTVYVRLDSLGDYPAAFRFLGELLDRRERTDRLERYAEQALKDVATAVGRIPANQRVSVYYAEGDEGLATEREASFHAELIPLAGGRNVHRGEALDHVGMETVSLEQVMHYNPQAILVQEREFFARVLADPRWQGVKGVRDKRVYLIPRLPFNWFDRPPSFMRLLGLKWLANALYPRQFPLDLARETREFYRLFLGVSLADADLKEVLSR